MRTFLIALVAVIIGGNAASADPLRIRGETMGTYYALTIDSPDDDIDAKALRAKIEQKLLEINRQMSTWDETSEISTFNKSRSTDWFAVSPAFAMVVAEAKRIHELTAGAFDPTVAPLIDLWGFGDNRKKEIPSDDAIAAALTTVGMQHIHVRDEPPALRKDVAEVQLNLSAIAKGYGVDEVAALLTAEGCPSFVVDIGGENRAGVAKASGDQWKIGVESPVGNDLYRIVELTKSSIATSGDYRNAFQVDGVSYSHAIDPVTGRSVKNPPASVSVISQSCMTADALATGLMVMNVQKGLDVANANNLSVMFQVVENGRVSDQSLGVFAEQEYSAFEEPGGDESTANETASSEAKSSAQWFPFAAAAVIFLVAVAGMAIGSMLQNKSIKGSCGGLASMPGSDGKSICELCTIPKDECTNADLREQMQNAAAQGDIVETDSTATQTDCTPNC